MKISSDLVSNSRASSFLIPINALTESQIFLLKNHIQITNSNIDEKWEIIVTEKCVYGFTLFDSFDMQHFIINNINIPDKFIYWSGTDGVKFSMNEEGNKSYELDLDKINQDIIKLFRKNKLNKIEYKQ